MKHCVLEKGKWETYFQNLKLISDGEESFNIDIGNWMLAPWCEKDFLATGPDVCLFNPRAKGNRWDEKTVKQRAKIKERAFGRFCDKT